jgi:hypothetical protein
VSFRRIVERNTGAAMRAVVLIELWVLCWILYQINGQNWEPSVKTMKAYCSSWAAQEPPRLCHWLPGIRWLLVCGHGSDGPWFQTRWLTCYIAERAERAPKRPPKMSSNIRHTFATAWVIQDHRRWPQQTCRSRRLDLPFGNFFFRLLHFQLFSSETVSGTIPWCAVPEEAI